MTAKTRITLLSNAEIEELYSIPNFTDHDRNIFFSLSNSDYQLLNQHRTLKLKVYFLLQLGYFRATQNFYNFTFEDILSDVKYLTHRYFSDSQGILEGRPYRVKIKAQQNLILKLYNYNDWSTNLTSKIMAHLAELIRYYPKAPNCSGLISKSGWLAFISNNRLKLTDFENPFRLTLIDHEIAVTQIN